MSNRQKQLLKQVLSLPMAFSQPVRDTIPGWQNMVHQFEENQISALQAAFLTSRPLLVRGDPGLGKSQLAPAIASKLELGFNSVTVNAATEIHELLYEIDLIQRFSDAHAANVDKALSSYLRPGVVWQSLSPHRNVTECFENADITPENPNDFQGQVLLIDEIDKAETNLPNALLEVLSNRTIYIPQIGETVVAKSDHPLLVIITSNDERALPAAFLRRCAVLDLRLPVGPEGEKHLRSVYEAHKDRLNVSGFKALDDDLVDSIAKEVLGYRQACQRNGQYAPGTSEFLDMLMALQHFPVNQRNAIKEQLQKILVNKASDTVK